MQADGAAWLRKLAEVITLGALSTRTAVQRLSECWRREARLLTCSKSCAESVHAHDRGLICPRCQQDLVRGMLLWGATAESVHGRGFCETAL